MAAPAHPAECRLFFALWPGFALRAALAARAAALPPPARPTAAPKLHLTLLFMDRASPTARPVLQALGEVIAGQTRCFDLVLDSAGLWAGGVAHLAPAAPPPALPALHDALAAAARGVGVAFDGRAFRPHVTLARRAAAAPPSAPPLPWHADSLVLVESLPGAWAAEGGVAKSARGEDSSVAARSPRWEPWATSRRRNGPALADCSRPLLPPRLLGTGRYAVHGTWPFAAG